jgi:maltose O-acetyltransferase
MLKKILKFLYPIVPVLRLRILILRLCGYQIGQGVYIPASLRISDLRSRRRNLKLGDRVSIGPGVTIVTDSSANNSRLVKLFPMVSGNVILDQDVWIGANVTILPGVHIGECSIVAAGAVVTEDVPSYTISGGVPAKVIRSIPEDEL